MSLTNSNNKGFTTVELLITVVIFAAIAASFFPFLNASFEQYMTLNNDAVIFAEVSFESQRIARVLRGSTEVVDAQTNEITVYAYFSPNDAYVSKIRYYKDTTNNKLFADVTPLTSNPPNGTEIISDKKTFTIIEKFGSGGNQTFTYLDSAGNPLALPISELSTIKGIRVTLPVSTVNSIGSESSTLSLDVSLRNKKTNL